MRAGSLAACRLGAPRSQIGAGVFRDMRARAEPALVWQVGCRESGGLLVMARDAAPRYPGGRSSDSGRVRMTTTLTVEVDEEELTAAAELLGTSSREETVRRLVANAAARAANVARKRAEIAEREAADRAAER